MPLWFDFSTTTRRLLRFFPYSGLDPDSDSISVENIQYESLDIELKFLIRNGVTKPQSVHVSKDSKSH